MSPETYIELYGPVAVKATRNTSIFPSVMLAQSILESGWGESGLTKESNNFFGIKSFGTKGKVYSTKEFTEGKYTDVKDSFRTYPTDLDSFKDFVNFLYENSRYESALQTQTPEDQITAIKQAGYATSPTYIEKILNLIDKYDLKKLDKTKKRMKNIESIGAVLLIVFGIYLLTLKLR